LTPSSHLLLASEKVTAKVKVTLRLTVSQSVCRGVEPNLELLTRDLFFSKLLSCLLGALSLTRGRVCHVSVFAFEVYNSQSLFTFKLKIYSVKHIYNTIYTGLIQSRLCTADYAILTSNLVYHGNRKHLNSRTHD
jgi:hypothetical protein